MFYPYSKLLGNSSSNDSYGVKKSFTLIINCLATLPVIAPMELRNV